MGTYGELIATVLEVGMVVALIVAVAYYRSKMKSREEEAVLAKSTRDQEAARAVAAEKDRAIRDSLRFQAAKEKAKDASIDVAIDAWVQSGKLWPKDN